MGKFIISEEERKHIMGLYEQSTTGTTAEQPNVLKPTRQNPLCNNMSGTYGTGSETNFKACVHKIGPSFMIELKDVKGNVLFSDGGSTFADAMKTYFSKAAQFYPDQKVGTDLPMPVNPDDESAAKYYKLEK